MFDYLGDELYYVSSDEPQGKFWLDGLGGTKLQKSPCQIEHYEVYI